MCEFPQWVVNLAFLITGAFIAYFFDIIKLKRNEKNYKTALLCEIQVNTNSSRNIELSSLLYPSSIFKSNIQYISSINKTTIVKIILFYSKISQFKDRITNQYEYFKGLSNEEKKNSAYWGTVELLANENKLLGEEIINELK
jgi:hypothetical protein